jgi:hypothetical protein
VQVRSESRGGRGVSCRASTVVWVFGEVGIVGAVGVVVVVVAVGGRCCRRMAGGGALSVAIDTDGAGRPCQPAIHALVKKPGHEPPSETLSVATNNFTSFLSPVAYYEYDYEYDYDDCSTFRPHSQSSISNSKQKAQRRLYTYCRVGSDSH